MKNYKVKIALTAAFIFAVFMNLNAQKFQGIATYQSGTNAKALKDYKATLAGMPPDLREHFMEYPGIDLQSKEFELKFNLTESTWKQLESLSKSGSFNITGTTYKNTAEKRYLRELEISTKPFLIADALVPLKWKLTKESKKIGDYTAYKATLEQPVKKQMETDGVIIYAQAKTLQVEAWYTPDIPVPHGPEEYWGLPGLILQFDNGTKTYLCTKVALNPEKGVRIKKPRRGKKINEKQLEEEYIKEAERINRQHQGLR